MMATVLDPKTELSPEYAELIADIFSEVVGRILSPDAIKAICGEDITISQLHALRYIFRHGGECSVTVLAEGLSVTTPAATKLIDRLEKHEWVLRCEDENDHRVFNIKLTDRGRDVTEKVKALRTKRMSEILLTMNSESRLVLLQGLESFVSAALTDQKMMEAICQHCGTEAFENGCIINRTHAIRIQDNPELLCS
jgi:DNA-binding MarR family transcriptional regulator